MVDGTVVGGAEEAGTEDDTIGSVVPGDCSAETVERVDAMVPVMTSAALMLNPVAMMRPPAAACGRRLLLPVVVGSVIVFVAFAFATVVVVVVVPVIVVVVSALTAVVVSRDLGAGWHGRDSGHGHRGRRRPVGD